MHRTKLSMIDPMLKQTILYANVFVDVIHSCLSYVETALEYLYIHVTETWFILLHWLIVVISTSWRRRVGLITKNYNFSCNPIVACIWYLPNSVTLQKCHTYSSLHVLVYSLNMLFQSFLVCVKRHACRCSLLLPACVTWCVIVSDFQETWLKVIALCVVHTVA